MTKLAIGDLVAIRGDIRRNYKGECVYTPDQLINNQYLKNTLTGSVWFGKVEKVDEKRQAARVAGGWRGLEYYEIIAKQDPQQCPLTPTRYR